jgi:CRP-like cAMP-binding protein
MSQARPLRNHQVNCLLAALEPEDFAAPEPHLEVVKLGRRQVLCETGETLRYAYFPHDTVISLVAVVEAGSSAEMSICGREGVVGLLTALISRQTFGRYIVQMNGTASRIDVDKMHEIGNARPTIRRVLWHFLEAIMARILQSVTCNALHSVEARC